MNIELLAHPLGAALQLFATIWALRLIPLTGKAKAWLVFSASFTLMGVRRFQKLTVGRELRMKELAEENTALRNQIAAQPDETKS